MRQCVCEKCGHVTPIKGNLAGQQPAQKNGLSDAEQKLKAKFRGLQQQQHDAIVLCATFDTEAAKKHCFSHRACKRALQALEKVNKAVHSFCIEHGEAQFFKRNPNDNMILNQARSAPFVAATPEDVAKRFVCLSQALKDSSTNSGLFGRDNGDDESDTE